MTIAETFTILFFRFLGSLSFEQDISNNQDSVLPVTSRSDGKPLLTKQLFIQNFTRVHEFLACLHNSLAFLFFLLFFVDCLR